MRDSQGGGESYPAEDVRRRCMKNSPFLSGSEDLSRRKVYVRIVTCSLVFLYIKLAITNCLGGVKIKCLYNLLSKWLGSYTFVSR